MTDDPDVLAPVSRFERAILDHPDRETTWAFVVAASLRTPGNDLETRLSALTDAVPILAARLDGRHWRRGEPPPVVVSDGDPVQVPGLVGRFELATEAPLRVVVDGSRRRVALAGHHAAFDGLALLAVLTGLLGGRLPGLAAPPPSGPNDGLRPILRRVLRPADRVAASVPRPPEEVRLARTTHLTGDAVTARLTAAAVEAFGSHNARLGAPWRRVGLSVGLRGPEGIGNVGTYRRVDVRSDADVYGAVAAAIARGAEPLEMQRSPRIAALARPLVPRLSDSLLVSNIGRHDLPAAERLEFYPVARGRSAVALGAAGLVDGASTVTLRARDLTLEDAERLLDETIAGATRRDP